MARVTARVTTKALFCSARAALLEDEYLFQRGKRCKARKERRGEGEQVYIYLLKEKGRKKRAWERICAGQRIHTNINSI